MKTFKTILFILAACILAIVSKILLPSDVNVEDFNSILVMKLGFPIVASLYFVMIYSHNAIIAKYLTSKSELSNIQCGLRTGLSFGLIYLFGMEEVVVEASPFAVWGMPFIVYQLVMGIGEAVMSLLLCICISCFVVPKNDVDKKAEKESSRNKFFAIVIITISFFIERLVLYKTEIISSDINTYPVPTLIWTVIFGVVLGLCFCMLYPISACKENPVKNCLKVSILSIGLCWIGFNLFIAFIYKDSIIDILIRCLTDVLFLSGASVLWRKCFIC